MTITQQRLYYTDSTLTEFSAAVLDQFEEAGRWHARLNRTAFYPTSGGQPHDTGWLNDSQVLDVYVLDGEVYHVLDRPLPTDGPVRGRVDWDRRFDHMQQHCGQHILSACFEQVLGGRTVGFHLGETVVTADIELQQLSPHQLQAVELKANQIVWENRAVTATFVQPQDLARFNLRQPPKVSHDIRIVSIAGLEDNPCGGTHPAFTGQVGQVKILGAERLRNATRVYFVCGKRALLDYADKVQVVEELCKELSTGQGDLANSVQKMKQSILTAQKAELRWQQRAVWHEAKEMVRQASVRRDGRNVVCTALESLTQPQDLKSYANAIVDLLKEKGEYAIALVAELDGRVHLLTAVSEGAPFGARDWLQMVMEQTGGKGGGNARAAQGSVQTSPVEPSAVDASDPSARLASEPVNRASEVVNLFKQAIF
ncbi:DHHA1 domain-containing protein [Alicyclobacillus tolerans]|uniref:alanyl-tRNA editing protein n=1 Tax=Alicyclobacillus tolerans TaxID=90970 RepID=UPI001F0213BF|nr:DHHA1 domain-containing protein [Alicyclobacillus tolerans]MCF8564056.1 DHHA1 domain-containing protein [Alicyclobacillus tolerans]